MTAYPEDPTGDMVPILEQSIEAAKRRHPSGNSDTPPSYRSDGQANIIALAHADRCDESCPQPALHRLRLREMELDFCGHHYGKHFPSMRTWGWMVIGTNFELAKQLAEEGV